MIGRNAMWMGLTALLGTVPSGVMALSLVDPDCTGPDGTNYLHTKIYQSNLRSVQMVGGPDRRDETAIFAFAACSAGQQVIVWKHHTDHVDPVAFFEQLILSETQYSMADVTFKMRDYFSAAEYRTLSRNTCFCQLTGHDQ